MGRSQGDSSGRDEGDRKLPQFSLEQQVTRLCRMYRRMRPLVWEWVLIYCVLRSPELSGLLLEVLITRNG